MSTKECPGCKETFTPDRVRRKYCSQSCYGSVKSVSLKGIRPKQLPGFPKGYTPKNKGVKAPNNTACLVCGLAFHTKPSRGAIFCSKDCLYKSKEDPEKPIRKLRQDVRRLARYKEWRNQILERDGGRCQKCGSTEELDVDHFPRTLDSLVRSSGIKYSAEATPEFWDLSNGRVLCKPCHRKELTSKNTKVNIRNSSVCVTGGAGMIGSHLVDELLARGNKVLVLDNLSAGDISYVSKDATFEWFDLRYDHERLGKILKDHSVQYVFHLVSLPYIPNCFGDPIPFFDVNARGTMNILAACEIAKVKKILVYSSAEIYGTKMTPIKETDVLNPQSTYGVAKVAAEQLAKARFVEAGLPVVVNRQFNVYSWRARHPYIIPELITQLSKGPNVKLGNIYAYRDFLYIDDAVAMVIELLERGTPGEEYNVGAENCIRIKELAELVGRLLGHDKIKISVDPSKLRPWDIARLEADISKLKNSIHYRVKFDIERGLKDVIKHFKANGNRWDY